MRGVVQTRIGKSRYASHVYTGRLELQDCLLCKSMRLALHVDSMCAECLPGLCTCHHAHLLSYMPWPGLSYRGIYQKSPLHHWFTMHHARCLQRLCRCIFRMVYKLAPAAFTSLLVHNSMTFEHMFGRFNSRLYSHDFAYADVLLDTYQQEACLRT